MLGRREDAGRGQREHQDEAQDEHRELADQHLHEIHLLCARLALHVPDREPQDDERQEQHARDVEDLGDLQRLDPARLERERSAGNLRGIEDSGSGPRAELDPIPSDLPTIGKMNMHSTPKSRIVPMV